MDGEMQGYAPCCGFELRIQFFAHEAEDRGK
jgi:hypothetical protein